MAKKKNTTSKKKRLNLRNTKKLPKAQDGLDLNYLDQNTQLFTPNSDQYQNLAANTVANNPNSFSNQGGLSNNLNTTTPNKSTSSFNAESVAKGVGYAGAAVNLIGDMDDGLTKAETQETVDMVGSTVGGAYYEGGKAVDQLLFEKDDQGLHENELQASLSYAITDPSQMVA